MRTRAARVLSCLALGLGAACADDPPAVDLYVDVAALVPGEVDELHVTLSALSPEGGVCVARTGLFNLPSADVLPIFVRIERGEEYTEGVMYRVSGWRDDQLALEPRVGWTTWPAEGQRELSLTLEAACLSAALSAPCAATEHCVGGACVALPDELPEELLDPDALDADSSCWNEP
jgi:hypothetical protein